LFHGGWFSHGAQEGETDWCGKLPDLREEQHAVVWQTTGQRAGSFIFASAFGKSFELRVCAYGVSDQFISHIVSESGELDQIPDSGDRIRRATKFAIHSHASRRAPWKWRVCGHKTNRLGFK
jgi:hypothetical protein